MILKIILGLIFFTISSVYFYFFFKRLLIAFNVNISFRIKLITSFCALILGSGCLNYLSFSAMIIYHFIVFNLIVYLLTIIIKTILKRRNKKISIIFQRIICVGIIPLLLTAAVLSYGYFNMNRVFKTSYNITSNKISQNYKFLLLSDIHFGTIQKTSVLKNSIEKFNELNLDFVILDGDIIDEYSSKESMQNLFDEIGKINTKYGIYYVYGNHDRQNKTTKRKFTEQDIVDELNKNSINILSDSLTLINNEIVLIGREDEQYNSKNRKEITEYAGLNTSKFVLVADHQPIGVKENEKNGVDLQVSGHTHAFQVWPLGKILGLFGFYTYGKYTLNNMNLIVTSGFAGWGFPIRTEKHCEYVVVNLISG